MKKTLLTALLILLSLANYAQQMTFGWARLLDGTVSGSTIINSMTLDSAGNIYTTGYYNGNTDLNPGSGTCIYTSPSGDAMFISKLDASGNFVWGKGISGSGDINSTSINTDKNENVFIAGTFTGTADFNPGSGINNLTSLGSTDNFILKLDASGNFKWVKQFGGNNDDFLTSMALDKSGNIYTTGFFSDTSDLDPGITTYNFISSGIWNSFVQKLDTGGNFVWAKKIAGDFTQAAGITIDVFGNVITTGHFSSTTDFDPGTPVFNLSPANPGWETADIYVQKLSSSGNFIWAKKFTGTVEKYVHSITTDALGNIYTCGMFNGTVDFNPSYGVPVTAQGVYDGFVAKLYASGTLRWIRRIGPNSHSTSISSVINCVTVDSLNNVYTTGGFFGTTDFDPGVDSFKLTSTGTDYGDIFFSKLDTNGQFYWAKSIGNTYDEIGLTIACDKQKNIVLGGDFRSTVDFDPDGYISNLTATDTRGTFIMKMKECNLNTTVTINGATLSAAIQSGAMYKWIDCDNGNLPIAGQTGNSFTATVNGHYAVVIIMDACVDTSACYTISSAGISENAGLDIAIYPNPATNNLTIELSNANNTTASIYNLEGQMLLERNLTAIKTEIDISSLTKGVYVIKLNGENGVAVKKFVKE